MGDSSKTHAIFHWVLKTIFIRLRAKSKTESFCLLVEFATFSFRGLAFINWTAYKWPEKSLVLVM